MKDCEMDRPTILVRRFFPRVGRRPRRGLNPDVRPLEGRRLLTGSASPATMTQTATFPDLESTPNLSNQAILYFNGTMGTLTEVDLVTSGSFSSQFSAENLASTSRTVVGTTGGNLSINLPTGAMPVAIPSVSQSFNASAFDGTLDYGGTSGKTLAPVTSSSTPQTTVLTSPAALAAFTGHFRIPMSVSGHATGSASPNDSNLSDSFKTDTSATVTVIYHYIPNLPGTGPAPGGSTPSPNGGGTGATITTTGTLPDAGHSHAVSARTGTLSIHARNHHSSGIHKAPPHRHPLTLHRQKVRPVYHAPHHRPGS